MIAHRLIGTDTCSTKSIGHLVVHEVSMETWLGCTRWHRRSTVRNDFTRILFFKNSLNCSNNGFTIIQKHGGCATWVSVKETSAAHCRRKGTAASNVGRRRDVSSRTALSTLQSHQLLAYRESQLLDVQALLSRRQLPSLFITVTMNTKFEVLKPPGLFIENSSTFFPAEVKPRLFYRPNKTVRIYNQFADNITKYLVVDSEQYFGTRCVRIQGILNFRLVALCIIIFCYFRR